MVRPTVLHDGFEPGRAVLEGVSQGWPALLASLRTLLETGETLPMPDPAGKPNENICRMMSRIGSRR